MVISKEGREFRRRVERLCAAPGGLLGNNNGNKKPPRIALCMDAFPPDRRRRDLDNLQKASLDSLAHAGVFQDDSLIDLLVVRRCNVSKPGHLEIAIYEFPVTRCPLCGGEYKEPNHD